MKKTLFFALSLVVLFGVGSYANAGALEDTLGGLLYFDTNLSSPKGQSCASCHHPNAMFVDPDTSLPVSEGVIAGRFGGRNSPMASYAAFSPEFYFDGEEGLWIGGQFWDGRAATLEEQAKGPFLNPLEMNNSSKEEVINKIRKSSYATLFKLVYGPKSLNNVEKAYDLVAKAIAAFERTKLFNSFTSKYDWFLRGKVQLTAKEARGLALFNNDGETPTPGLGAGRCILCHPSERADDGSLPLFTDFSYDNLGIPVNPEIAVLKGEPVPVDYGLGATVGSEENGKFKVMTLRNIARTAPYGHNGYFKTLKEIVHFYNTRDALNRCVGGADESPGVNCWPEPEVNNENVNTGELGNLGLTSEEEDDIVAFLQTLTDGYYCAKCN
jgi:cytochrome c peroxidase